ncbi:MAG TPA: transglutaminase domain-containing protein, partial [Thermoanaerobaculia bacterium]|nr:transglutaminase domain-containing protein [Thermoanaerobaculia bacterium]
MRKETRWIVGWTLLAAGLVGESLAGQTAGEGDAGPLPSDRQVVEALAAGREVGPLVERLRERLPRDEPRPSRAVLPEAPSEAFELNRALAELLRVLPPPLAQDGSGLEARAGPAPVAAQDLLAAYESLRAADLLFRERFAAVGRRLDATGVPDEVREHLAAAEAAYEAAMAEILGPLEPEMAKLREASSERRSGRTPEALVADLGPALARVRQAIETLSPEPAPEVLRAAILPYGRLSLGQRTPATTPIVMPSYLDPTDVHSTPEDLGPSPLAPLSEPILLKAEELGYDYIRIFELVRNGIDTEWYAGAMKGAEETLRQGRGNDADQAALLVALLRAAGAPARFVTGVVELPVAAVADDLGFVESNADRVAEALRRAGVAHRPVVRGGQVAAFEVEHAWVAARIPYANYRGAVVDFSGATWIPFAPAVKGFRMEPAAGVVEEMAGAGELSVGAFVDEILASLQPSDPLSTLRARVTDYLARTGGGAYDEALREQNLEPQDLGLLPSSLPFRVAAVTGEGPHLPTALVHRVRFLLRAGDSETAPVVLDWTAPLPELAGRRATLSYLPASVDDHRTVNAFGGLHSVPLYLVRLRPQLKVDGRSRAVGEESVAAGLRHRLEVRLLAPAGEERVGRSLVAAGYYAFDLAAQRGTLRELAEDDPADTETLGAALLARIAGSYAAAWGEAEEELAALMGIAVVRPLPSVAVAAGAVEVETVLGLPEQLRWEGVTLDAALRVAEPVAGATGFGPPAAGRAGDWLALAALQGSALEHRLFQDLFLVDGISADKGFALARQAGIEVIRLTPANLAAELPRLQHPAAVETEIENWVRLGFEVEAPRTPVSRKAWRGSVWRVVDPQARGAGYFIAGGLAGGATTEPPGTWVLQFLADALAAPYAPEPGDDPLAGVEAVKILATDRQEGTVGQTYPEALAVLVRDEAGRPVKGAPVSFEVWTGGGSLLDGAGQEVQSLLTTTNALGLASATFRSGTSTEAEPVYVHRAAADTWATRALMNLVEVTVASHLGTLVPESP